MATVETITRQEILTELDRQARAKLGISGEQFVKRYTAGKLNRESPTISRLAVLARLITNHS